MGHCGFQQLRPMLTQSHPGTEWLVQELYPRLELELAVSSALGRATEEVEGVAAERAADQGP